MRKALESNVEKDRSATLRGHRMVRYFQGAMKYEICTE